MPELTITLGNFFWIFESAHIIKKPKERGIMFTKELTWFDAGIRPDLGWKLMGFVIKKLSQVNAFLLGFFPRGAGCRPLPPVVDSFWKPSPEWTWVGKIQTPFVSNDVSRNLRKMSQHQSTAEVAKRMRRRMLEKHNVWKISQSTARGDRARIENGLRECSGGNL